MLCIVSSYYDVMLAKRVADSVQKIALRQETIHCVGCNMLAAETKSANHNIITVAHVICSGLVAREESRLVYLEEGLESMIKLRGGLQRLDAPIASTISWIMLEYAILLEKKPHHIYREHSASRSSAVEDSDRPLPFNSPLYSK